MNEEAHIFVYYRRMTNLDLYKSCYTYMHAMIVEDSLECASIRQQLSFMALSKMVSSKHSIDHTSCCFTLFPN